MPVEVAQYIHELNPANPVGTTDLVSTGDDHLRMLKAVLQNTFAAFTGPLTVTDAQINLVVSELAAKATALNALTVDQITDVLAVIIPEVATLTATDIANIKSLLAAKITLLNSLTVTAVEINRLTGVTGNVEPRLVALETETFSYFGVFITESGLYTIPKTGIYVLEAVGGGQGGDGGGDGNGGTWSFCSNGKKNGTYDANRAGPGNSTVVEFGASTILRARGGNSGDTNVGLSNVNFPSESEEGVYGSCCQNLSPVGAGGKGADSLWGTGGAGGANTTVPGEVGTGYGAGGGGGGVQDGAQVGSYGAGGKAADYVKTYYSFTANDQITVTIGTGGDGYPGLHGPNIGGTGAPGALRLVLWAAEPV